MKSIIYKVQVLTVFVLLCTLVFAQPTSAIASNQVDLTLQLQQMQSLLQSLKAKINPSVLGASVVKVKTTAELVTAISKATGGETIQLAPGNYGKLVINTKKYATPVTITSEDPANRAVITGFDVLASKNVVVDSMDVKYTYPITAATPPPWYTSVNNIKSSQDVVVSNMMIYGDIDATGYGALTGVVIRAGTNVTFKNNYLENWNIALVNMQSSDLVIDGNEITKISGDGIENVELQRVTLSNNYIHDFLRDPNSNMHPDMIQFWTTGSTKPTTDITIKNNRLDIGNGSWTQSMFMRNEAVDTNAVPGTAMFYKNFLIENNTINNLHLHGITLGQADGVIIRGNTLTSAPTTITNPTTVNFLKQYSSNNGIYSPSIRPSFYSTNVTVEDNQFLGQPSYKLTRLTGYTNQTDWTVRNNTINGVQIGAGTTNPAPTAPTVSLSSSATTVAIGGSATLTWSTTNTTSCAASGDWTGTKTTSSSQSTGALATAGTKTFTLTCTGTGGSVTKSVSVDVTNTTTPPATGLSYSTVLSTYLDGASSVTTSGMTRDVAFDSQGNLYVAGGTQAKDFPTTPGAYDETFNTGGKSTGSFGEWDVFLMKFSPSGTLLWSTLIGGGNYDRAYAVEVGPNDDVFVAGRAGEGYPTTSGTVQPTFLNNASNDAGYNAPYGRQNGFITKFDKNGKMQWSTYMTAGIVRDIDVDNQGNVHAVPTQSKMPNPHITSNAFQKNNAGSWDGMYTKISADGKTLLYGTYIGGSGDDGSGPAVRVDASGNAYYNAVTTSKDFPTKNAFQTTFGGGTNDTVAVKFAADGSVVYSSYFGGNGIDSTETHGVAIDNTGNAYFGATTFSTNLSIKNGLGTKIGGTADAMIGKVSPTGQLLASTYVGGSNTDSLQGIVFDNVNQQVIFSGITQSNGVATAGAVDTTLNGSHDGTIAILSADLTKKLYATYVGGSGSDEGRSIDVHEATGRIALGGQTDSTNFPLVNTVDSSLNSKTAAMVSVIAPGGTTPSPTAPTLVLSSTPTSVTTGASATLTWSSTNATACTASGDWSGTKPVNGSASTGVLSTSGTKNFTLVCTGAGGSVSKIVSVVVNTGTTPVVTSPLTAGMRVETIGTVNVRSAAAGSVLGTQTNAQKGTVLDNTPAISGSYTFIKVDFDNGVDGWVADAFMKQTAVVVPPSTTPTVTFTASALSITAGSKASLTWTSANAQSCQSSGTWGSSARPTSGSFTTDSLNSVGTKTFSLTCTGTGGSVTKSLSISVTAVAPVVIDTDKDTVADSSDNCPTVSNLDQANFDADTQGDVCDTDDDNDGIVDTAEKTGCIFDAADTCGTTKTPTLTLTVTPTVLKGSSATVTWSSTNVTSCTASDEWQGGKATSGTYVTSDRNSVGTETYTMTCTGSNGTVTKSATSQVIDSTTTTKAPTLTFTNSPTQITAGKTATLTWSTTDATSCTSTGVWDPIARGTSGTFTTASSLTEGTKTYTLTCVGAGGSVTKSVTLTVSPVTTPTLTLTATPKVVKGGSAVVTWSSTNASSCIASGEWSGTKETSGSYTKTNRNWLGKETYTLTCTGTGGSITKSAITEVVATISSNAPKSSLVSSTVSSIIPKNTVQAKDSIRVRLTPNGTILGMQAKGAIGELTSTATTVLDGYTWVHVNFASGADGYVAKENLAVSSVLGASTSQDASVYLEQLTNLVNQLQELKQSLK